VHNWSWEPTGFAVPARVRRLGSDTPIEPGGPLSLGPWDVQILVDFPETS
jgi:beta-galactosidase